MNKWILVSVESVVKKNDQSVEVAIMVGESWANALNTISETQIDTELHFYGGLRTTINMWTLSSDESTSSGLQNCLLWT